MRIAHLSDVHFSNISWNPLRFFSKRIVGSLNSLLFRKRQHNPLFLKELPALFSDLKIDLVLVAGDLTTTSLPSEFYSAQKFFNTIEQKIIFIPGNHDHYTKRAQREGRFYSYVSNKKERPLGESLDFFTLKDHGLEIHQIESFGWCIALDTAFATPIWSANGFFSPVIEANLNKALTLLPSKDKIILLNHFPFFQNDEPKHCLIRGENLRLVLENYPNICLYLHGHTHRHSIANLPVSELPLVLDSGCAIQKEFATWNLIDLFEKECTISPYYWQGTKWGPFSSGTANIFRYRN